ncbi:VOC family protein [Pollutimonas sp. H1-120]|uniref:VOC family protein n=1 Tax=Pollutimonas sp. H1-120 TaxID=3148824 RepID=UPI003B52DB39
MNSPLSFDHLVLMLRDRLVEQAPAFEADGYTLTELSAHNLGSMNRLITLDSAYIELLGWPSGQAPARKEIADSPMGPEALVFRTPDAHATHRRLQALGFRMNPVVSLERPINVRGQAHTARFETVRFAEQPIEGFRLYFCQHLTPELVWNPESTRHANGAAALARIVLCSAHAGQTAQILAQLTDAPLSESGLGTFEITLDNVVLEVRQSLEATLAIIDSVALRRHDGQVRAFETHVRPPRFAQMPPP